MGWWFIVLPCHFSAFIYFYAVSLASILGVFYNGSVNLHTVMIESAFLLKACIVIIYNLGQMFPAEACHNGSLGQNILQISGFYMLGLSGLTFSYSDHLEWSCFPQYSGGDWFAVIVCNLHFFLKWFSMTSLKSYICSVSQYLRLTSVLCAALYSSLEAVCCSFG